MFPHKFPLNNKEKYYFIWRFLQNYINLQINCGFYLHHTSSVAERGRERERAVRRESGGKGVQGQRLKTFNL